MLKKVLKLFGFGKCKIGKINHPFTVFILKVDTASPGWQKTVGKVLGNTKEVKKFRMLGDGMVEVSGTVDPVLLLKVLAKKGKNAQLVDWKFGQCSNNLYMMHDYGYGRGNDYGATNYGYNYQRNRGYPDVYYTPSNYHPQSYYTNGGGYYPNDLYGHQPYRPFRVPANYLNRTGHATGCPSAPAGNFHGHGHGAHHVHH